MATDKKMKADVLAKIAQQIAMYFAEAYDKSQQNRVLKAFQKGGFASVLYYHSEYFKASAWFVLGISRFTEAKETGRDMGIAAGTAVYAA